MKLAKFYNFIKFVLFLIITNLLFLFFYYKNLDLGLSLVTILFVSLFAINYVLLLHIFKNIYLRILVFIFFISILIYGLINFAYYEVFNTFLQINFSKISQVNASLIDMLLDYYYLIPGYVYFLSLVLLFSVVFGTIYYLKRSNQINQKISDIYFKINLLKNKKKKFPYGYCFVLILFLLVNFSFYVYLTAYKQNFNKDNFSRIKYLSDLGMYGFLFSEFSEGIATNIKNIYSADKDIIANNADERKIDKIKDNLKKLSLLKDDNVNQTILLKEKIDNPHVIIYQLESVGSWTLKQEPTPMPYLEKLISENISVDHFFPNSCTTINAEFTSVCSFYPESTGPISDLFAYNDYHCLPTILKDKYGYKTSLYHANLIDFWSRDILFPEWGYEDTVFSPVYKVRADDSVVILDAVKRINNSEKPTFNYIVGFTSHGPHNQKFIDFNEEYNDLIIEPYQQKINSDLSGVEVDEGYVRNYFGFLNAVDDSIEMLFDELAKRSLLDNTIVIIYGDHRYYNFETDDKVADFYNYNEVPLAVYVPGGYKGKIKKIASQIDIAPTILNIIEGDEYELPENFLGQSLFSAGHNESAINKCLGESFYIDEDIIVQNDVLLDIQQPIAYLHKYAKYKIKEYSNYLKMITEESDYMIVNNLLGGKANASSEKIDKQIYIDEYTDSDKDGISDLREKAIGTNILESDSDNDGYIDGLEIINGYNPLGEGKN